MILIPKKISARLTAILKFTACIVCLALLQNCAHGVRVISIPAGATLKKNGKVIGQAPMIFHERSGPPLRTNIFEAELTGFGALKVKEPVRLCRTPGNLLLDSLVVGIFVGYCQRDEIVMDFTQPAPVN